MCVCDASRETWHSDAVHKQSSADDRCTNCVCMGSRLYGKHMVHIDGCEECVCVGESTSNALTLTLMRLLQVLRSIICNTGAAIVCDDHIWTGGQLVLI